MAACFPVLLRATRLVVNSCNVYSKLMCPSLLSTSVGFRVLQAFNISQFSGAIQIVESNDRDTDGTSYLRFDAAITNIPPMAPLTISALPQLACDVQILHIFIPFGKLLFFLEISPFQLPTVVDSFCIGNMKHTNVRCCLKLWHNKS